MTTTAVRHQPDIRQTYDSSGRVYQFRCTCGARGALWARRAPAREELKRHTTTLPPVPDDQRCRDERHKVPHWEACQLCANQLALFELGE